MHPSYIYKYLRQARCSHFSCKKQAKQKRQLTQPAITINTERWIRHSEERCHPASQRATQGWQWQDKNVIYSPISKNNAVNIHWPTETSNLNTESCSTAHTWADPLSLAVLCKTHGLTSVFIKTKQACSQSNQPCINRAGSQGHTELCSHSQLWKKKNMHR